MKRIRLIVAYDGTRYCGWQLQKNGNTIEAELNLALKKLTGEDIKVIGASRTDSGVHALGNIAVFDSETKIPPEKICYALNQKLPEDIVVQASEEVDPDYHPRKCNSLKTYEYVIWNHRFANPKERLYTYHVHWELDVEKMKQAISYLRGEHDFSSFCSMGGQATDTIRKIYDASVEQEGSRITIRLTGNGFLYNMVRIIAGTLLDIGKGRWEPEYIKDMLHARNREAGGTKAPAEGLTLMKIEHLEKLPDRERNTNEWIDYELDRLEEGITKMRIFRSADSERRRMILRSANHAFRDGKTEIQVFGDKDIESGKIEEIIASFIREQRMKKESMQENIPGNTPGDIYEEIVDNLVISPVSGGWSLKKSQTEGKND